MKQSPRELLRISLANQLHHKGYPKEELWLTLEDETIIVNAKYGDLSRWAVEKEDLPDFVFRVINLPVYCQGGDGFYAAGFLML